MMTERIVVRNVHVVSAMEIPRTGLAALRAFVLY